MRTVRFQVTRTETWYPEYEVPELMTDEEALDYILNESPDSVFDEMLNKYTLDTDVDVEIS
mgnify:CR=1 FL=1